MKGGIYGGGKSSDEIKPTATVPVLITRKQSLKVLIKKGTDKPVYKSRDSVPIFSGPFTAPGGGKSFYLWVNINSDWGNIC